MNVLVTGGAGFIGSHLVDALVARGHRVRVLDCLAPQVHGPRGGRPDYLHPDAELRVGDVRDRNAVHAALDDVDVVFHEAAAVGVGQSMYEIEHYVSVNALGAAVLLEVVLEHRDRIRKLVVASSMSIYGEGAYRDAEGAPVAPALRSDAQLARREWDLADDAGRPLAPAPTPEDKPLRPTSIYAVTKRDHEEMFLSVGAAYRIPTVALRYFNVYGPRQALSNPYTGVAAIFSSRLLNGRPPILFEDGRQSRDFVHVSDVVQANLLAMERDEADGRVYNVGTGRPVTVREIADALAARLGSAIPPELPERFRAGDVRHCYADVSRIREELGYAPRVALEDGFDELVDWVRHERADDLGERARAELEKRGLAR